MTTTKTEERATTAPVTDADLVNWFTYHPPREGQPSRYELLRAQGLVLARLIHGVTPPGDDQSEAIRHVRDAVMTANAAIACEDDAHQAKELEHLRTAGIGIVEDPK